MATDTSKCIFEKGAVDIIVDKIKAKDGYVDTSNDTVTADVLLEGYTAHDAAGNLVTGTATAGKPTKIDKFTQSTGMGNTKTYNFEVGMTWRDFVNSSYNTGLFSIYTFSQGYDYVTDADDSGNVAYPATSLPRAQSVLADEYITNTAYIYTLV